MNPRNVRYHRFGLKDDFALKESQRRLDAENK